MLQNWQDLISLREWMIKKRLLCLVPTRIDMKLPLGDIGPDWEICRVSNLDDAAHELGKNRFSVGLLMHDRELGRLTDVSNFLRRYSQFEWIGVFEPSDLRTAPCRDLIVDHLCDYHTIPVSAVRMAHAIGHAHGRAELYRAPWCFSADRITHPILGNCGPIERLRAQIDRIAKVSAPVLIWGESGTGKELTAQAIHTRSDRLGGPFVPVNCGAIAPSLIQSELFGYKRGAFTGASYDKIGLIESANGGTLFLDEIGDLPRDLQANLLRFLQEKTISRLGSTENIRVDVRVIAASHVNLQQAVCAGAFREDLYYRLAVIPVTVPALRERTDDLVMLAEHFFCFYANEKSPRLKGFSEEAISAIVAHNWPGNVRELINRVRRALVMSDGRLIKPEDLGLPRPIAPADAAVLNDERAHSERLALCDCLNRSGQNVSLAARRLGISRTTMYRLLSKHGLRQAASVNDSTNYLTADLMSTMSHLRRHDPVYQA